MRAQYHIEAFYGVTKVTHRVTKVLLFFIVYIMFDAFNVDAIKGIYDKLVAMGIEMFFDSFEEAVDHAYTMLMNSGCGLRGKITPQRLINNCFDRKTLSFYRKNMKMCFGDVAAVNTVADDDLMTVYMYIAVIVGRTAFHNAKSL